MLGCAPGIALDRRDATSVLLRGDCLLTGRGILSRPVSTFRPASMLCLWCVAIECATAGDGIPCIQQQLVRSALRPRGVRLLIYARLREGMRRSIHRSVDVLQPVTRASLARVFVVTCPHVDGGTVAGVEGHVMSCRVGFWMPRRIDELIPCSMEGAEGRDAPHHIRLHGTR